MMFRLLPLLLLAESAWTAALVPQVREAIAQNNFDLAERSVREYRAQHGVTPEMLDALSWLGRGALAEKQLDRAARFAAETERLAEASLKKWPIASDPHIAAALGAAIEVQTQVMAARGKRAEALAFLDRQLTAYRATPIQTRIQKNINLLSLEGKPAPALDLRESLGPPATPLDKLRGHPVLLFFWAHWCPDCRSEGPVLARLLAEFGRKGLVLIGPTRRYGYAAGGAEATPAQELAYIDRIRREHFGSLPRMPAPVSEKNFENYGASSTPTLVLVDRRGIVRLYHPGSMSYKELRPRIERLLSNGGK